MKKHAHLLLITLFILWFFAVFGGFYLVQKPFTPAAAGALTGAFLDLLTAGWIGLLGLGLGHRLLRFTIYDFGFTILDLRYLTSRPPTSNPPALQSSNSDHDLSTGEILILGSGLGLGALGLLTLGLGLAGLFYRWLFILISVILTLLLWADWLALWRRLRRWPPKEDRPGRLVALYLVTLSFFALTMALLPPIDWDGLFYHLTGPKIFIQAHRISPGINIPHFNFPFLAEMLFTYAMLLRGDIAAKLTHALFGLLLAGLVYLMARRHLNRASAWPAVLVFLSMPMVVTLAGWAYNDLTLAFYQLAALYALLRSQMSVASSQMSVASSQMSEVEIPNPQPSTRFANLQPSTPNLQPASRTPNPRWLVLSGVFAGLAMGLKYTSFVGPLTLGLILIWWQVTGYRSQVAGHRSQETAISPSIHNSQFTIHNSQFLPLLYFALPAFLVALPWYLKNFFFTGNPFYPFLSGIFDGFFWDSFRAEAYAQAGTGIGFDLPTLLSLPVLATLGVKDVNYFDGRTGPLFLAFLPLILLYGLFRYPGGDRARRPERPPALDLWLIFALAQFSFWTLGVIWSRSLWQSRLLLTGLTALSPVIGWLWQDLVHLDRPGFSLRRFANLLISLVLVLNLVELTLSFVQVNPLAYLTGRETRAEYLTRRLGAYYATIEQLNETLPSTAVVLLLWEPRSYFCQVECRPDSILDQLAHDQYLYQKAAQIVRAWHKAGITHVLLNRQGLDFIKNEDTAGSYKPALEQLTVLQAHYFEPVFDVVGAYQLYELRE